MPCRAIQDGQVMVESSDKTWFTGKGGGSYGWLAMQCESAIYRDMCYIYKVLWIYLGECHLPGGDAKKMLKICFIESLNVQQKRILQICSDVGI